MRLCYFEIVKLYRKLSADKKEFILSKQMLRSGTSIGANVNEAVSGQSKKDFIHKMSIALKESRETLYWLKLLTDTEFLSADESKKISNNCTELIKILTSIIITTKERYLKSEKNQT